MSVQHKAWHAFRSAFIDKRPISFKTNALSAISGSVFATGELPPPHREEYRKAAEEGLITYTVLSYRTPIAWVLESGEVVIPEVRYSVTTSGHQGIAATWLTYQGPK